MNKARLLLLLFVAVEMHGDLPVASLISTAVRANDRVEVIGAAGAVPSGADVLIVTLETGHYSLVQAAPDGGFRGEIFGPPGATLMIKVDRGRTLVRPAIDQSPVIDFHFNQLIELPGTLVRLPDPPSTNGEVAFGAARIHRTGDRAEHTSAPVSIRGSLSSTQLTAGENVTVRVSVRIYAGAGGASPRVRAQLSLIPLTHSDGSGRLAIDTFASTVMTPAGLPIERSPWPFAHYQATGVEANLLARDGALEAELTITLPIPPDLPHAYYRPTLLLNFEQVSLPSNQGQRLITFFDGAGRSKGTLLPLIRIGQAKPPTFPLALLMNDVEQAMRGVAAREDRRRFGISPRVALASDRLTIPRTDPRSGAPRRYSLEPFAPTLSLGDRGAPPSPPLVPFRFPSGELRVSIHGPDGAVTILGPAPFIQDFLAGPGRNGGSMEGGPYITDAYRLTTRDSRFDFEFPTDGAYEIRAEVVIDDIWGTRWSAEGTFEIDVARALVIEPSTMIGTQFEAGDSVAIGATVMPPIPAEIRFRIRFAPHSRAKESSEWTGVVHTGRFGYGSTGAFRFEQPGEYRIDIEATGTDSHGTRWAGSRTWGGVVADADPPVIAHGVRGIDDEPEEGRRAWFFKTPASGRGHVNLAYHSGDVMWLEEVHALTPVMSFHDPNGEIPSLMRRYCCSPWSPAAEQRGELPLFSANFDALDVHLVDREADLVAYSYRFVERPQVRVREIVAEGMSPYWRFNDLYGRQLGNGANGDLPNDFKFQFGGVVVRGKMLADARYDIYGSLFVLLPESDPMGTRVLPPFRGNGGGSDGGPLFRLKGRDIDLFFHPTAVRPGTILHRGAIASFAGYSAPTLPSKIEIVVTSPSGRLRTISGQANKIGYFHDPSQDFTVGESGVWKAKVKILFDGRTSAGQVTEPFPSGDVLGSRAGEFYFYVVDSNANDLDIAALPQFVRPADGPITFTIQPPPGLSNRTLTYTTTMPGFILEEGTKLSMTYTWDATRLAHDFPNLDLNDADGLAGADTITISFLLTGTESGRTKHYARQIVIQGEELQMPAQEPRPKRRAVR